MKVLITDNTKVNYGDDRGAIHQDSGSIVNVPKDTAKKLTENNRALYVDPKDDPFKDRRFTASKEMLEAAARLAKAKAKVAKPASESDDGGTVPGTGSTPEA